MQWIKRKRKKVAHLLHYVILYIICINTYMFKILEKPASKLPNYNIFKCCESL